MAHQNEPTDDDPLGLDSVDREIHIEKLRREIATLPAVKW